MASSAPISWRRAASGTLEPHPMFRAEASLSSTRTFMEAIFPPTAKHTYAVMDAAKIFGFQEVLESSGMQHECLYRGRAQERWGDVAPWLVRLKADHALTRELLLKKNNPASFSFLKAPALFLTTDYSFDVVLKHLRRFTKVRAEDGRVLLLRFYDPITFSDLLEAMPSIQVSELIETLKVTYLLPDGEWCTVESVEC
ncbi:protein of unknown function [Tritonibacter mobilis]|nr:protein of unknown function [Tritonibacter mobilis]